jgi:hypothetical protein
MKHLLIVLLCANAISSFAQKNTTNWDTLVNDPTKFNVFSVPVAPADIPDLKPFTTGYTWENILQVGLGVFYDAPKLWSDSTQYHTDKEIVAQAFDNTHYQARALRYEIGITYPKKHSNYTKFYAEVMKPIFVNPALRESVYAWAAPQYKRIFKMLPANAQKLYLEIIGDVVAFLKTYDYAKELKYHDKLVKKGNIYDFVLLGNTKNKTAAYQNCPRSLAAFLFRRIHNGDLSQAELLDYATRFERVLQEK